MAMRKSDYVNLMFCVLLVLLMVTGLFGAILDIMRPPAAIPQSSDQVTVLRVFVDRHHCVDAIVQWPGGRREVVTVNGEMPLDGETWAVRKQSDSLKFLYKVQQEKRASESTDNRVSGFSRPASGTRAATAARSDIDNRRLPLEQENALPPPRQGPGPRIP